MRSHRIYKASETLSFCLFVDSVLCLDVADDRYFRLKLPTLAERDDDVRIAQVADALRRRILPAPGLVPADLIRPTMICVPGASLLEGTPESAVPPEFGRVFSALTTTALALRLRPLRRILTDVQERKSGRQPDPATSSMMTLTAAFHRHRKLVPMAPACLLDSLALLRFLCGFGYYPTLVFGVTARPFSAHCWVQTDEMILSDAADHAGHFRPILAL